MLRTKLIFIKRVLYKLKRSYGLPVQYYVVTESVTNPATGDKTTTYSKVDITRAIVLRAREYRSFVYDLAYISANKDFTTGGFFDPEDRQVIIEASDVAVDFEPNIDDFIIFQNCRYDVKEVLHFEDNYGWALTAKKIRGAPIIRIEDNTSVLNLGQGVTSEIFDSLTRSVTSVLELTGSLQEVV